MSEPENFLERWSKRKLAKDEPAAPEGAAVAPYDESKEKTAAPPADAAEAPAAPPLQREAFDPASLPPIESIGANTDVTAFLRPGVPPELTRAALRRAWSADPGIRDFVGLVESGWDFNDPQAMAGFGPIDAGEVARLAAQAIGELPAAIASAPPEAAKPAISDSGEGQKSAPAIPTQADRPAADDRRDAIKEPSAVQRNIKNDAPQKTSDG